MTTRATVRAATTADIEALVRVFVEAFRDDPLYTWFMDPHRFSEVMAQMFRADIEHRYLPGGGCYLTEDGAAAAAWVPPPGPPATSALARLRSIPRLASISGLARLPRIWRLLARCTEEHPHEPHWYLSLLGVEPPRQREGVGSALLAHVLERVDADRLPAYLENSKERNLAFYERHGFRTLKRIEFARGGPYLWLMWRDPVSR